MILYAVSNLRYELLRRNIKEVLRWKVQSKTEREREREREREQKQKGRWKEVVGPNS